MTIGGDLWSHLATSLSGDRRRTGRGRRRPAAAGGALG